MFMLGWNGMFLFWCSFKSGLIQASEGKSVTVLKVGLFKPQKKGESLLQFCTLRAILFKIPYVGGVTPYRD